MARMQWAKGGGAGGGPGGSSALTTPWAAIILCFPPRWKQGEGARDGGHMRGASGGKMLQGGGGGGRGGIMSRRRGTEGLGEEGMGVEKGGGRGKRMGEEGSMGVVEGGVEAKGWEWISLLLLAPPIPLPHPLLIPSCPFISSVFLSPFFPSPIPLLSSPPLHPSFPHSLIHSRPPIPSPSPKSFLEWRATQQAAAERCNIHQGLGMRMCSATSHPLLCFPPFPSSLLPPSLRYPTPSPPPLFPHLPPFIQRGYVDVDAPYNRPSYAMPHPTPPHRTHRTPI
ncbi:unnamed protein product [Closterium sp. NIES-65]|nr:unnamed protein product [Closterium sp. NIES-65]